MSLSGWTDKQNEVYLCNGILFGHENEESTGRCHNMDETWNSAKSKKPVTKDHMLYDFIRMKSRKRKSLETEGRFLVA